MQHALFCHAQFLYYFCLRSQIPCVTGGTEICDLIVTTPKVLSPLSFGLSLPSGINSKYAYHHYDRDCKHHNTIVGQMTLNSIFASRLYCLSMTHVASPLRFNIGHVKILDSSPSYFHFPSETSSNMVLKMLAIELWVVRQFNLEIFCSNVYGDNDETMIFYQWNESH